MYYREGDGLFEVAELNAKHALAEGRVANAVRARKVATSGYTRRWVSRMRRNYAAAATTGGVQPWRLPAAAGLGESAVDTPREFPAAATAAGSR